MCRPDNQVAVSVRFGRGLFRCGGALIAVVAIGVCCAAQSNTKTINVTLTTIDVPGAVYTEMNGINSAGDMVGNYGQSTSGVPDFKVAIRAINTEDYQ